MSENRLTKTLLTRVTPEMHAAIKIIAVKQDRTVCAVIRAALAAYIKEAEGDDTASD